MAMHNICPFKLQGVLSNSSLATPESNLTALQKLAGCEKAKCSLWMEHTVEEDDRELVREGCALQLGWVSLGMYLGDVALSVDDARTTLARPLQALAAIVQVASGIAATKLGLDLDLLKGTMEDAIGSVVTDEDEDEEEDEEEEEEEESKG